MASTRSGHSAWRRATPLAALCGAALLGCGGATQACPQDLRVRVTPTARTVSVGESFTATAQAFGCGGTRPLADTWVWSTADSAVVAVDSLTGRITGRAPGTARVLARGLNYGMSGLGVQVTVQ